MPYRKENRKGQVTFDRRNYFPLDFLPSDIAAPGLNDKEGAQAVTVANAGAAVVEALDEEVKVVNDEDAIDDNLVDDDDVGNEVDDQMNSDGMSPDRTQAINLPARSQQTILPRQISHALDFPSMHVNEVPLPRRSVNNEQGVLSDHHNISLPLSNEDGPA